MKKTLVTLGTLLALAFGVQTFAACPCADPCPCPACPVAAPCCREVLPCPACPINDPCPSNCANPCACDNYSHKEKCSWWKFWQNKNCCYKCDKCNHCNKCNSCCD